MITLTDTLRIQARANRLANRRLHAAMAPLPEADFHAARVSFFPSLAATLNHILAVDLYYIGALHGDASLPQRFDDFVAAVTLAELAERQRESDERLIAFCDRLDEAACSINQLHEEAMNMAENAFLAQQKGDKMAFVQLSKKAFLLEKEAALLLQNKLDAEPNRSVLFKSAAFLAFDAQEYQECRDMITYTLLGKPDNIIKAEMNQLFDEVSVLLKKMPSRLDDFKTKIARLDGGKEILREIELSFAQYGTI